MYQAVIARFVAARALSSFGRAIISATLYFELFHRTGSTLVISSIGAVQVLPVVLMFTYSGALVDRSDRRRLATMTTMTTGLIGIGLAIASAMDAPVPVYWGLLLVLGAMTSIQAPASGSLLPLILPREELEKANRAMSSAGEVAMILGPALAGLAIDYVPAHYIYGFVALTGISSGILYRSLPEPRAVAATGGAARKDWRTGLRFIFRSPLLLPALTLDMFAVLFAGVTALLPVVASQMLHTSGFGYGVLRAAQSVGAVIMAVLGSRLPAWKRPGRVLLIVVALFGLATMGIGFSHTLWITAGLLVICGALDNISVVIRLTLEQNVVPDAIRGRVGAVHYVFIGMSNELGGAESGLAADLLGTPLAIIGGGALAMVVTGLVALKFRELARMPPLAELQPHPE